MSCSVKMHRLNAEFSIFDEDYQLVHQYVFITEGGIRGIATVTFQIYFFSVLRLSGRNLCLI